MGCCGGYIGYSDTNVYYIIKVGLGGAQLGALFLKFLGLVMLLVIMNTLPLSFFPVTLDFFGLATLVRISTILPFFFLFSTHSLGLIRSIKLLVELPIKNS